MSADAARETWESIKRRPEVAQLVRKDSVFQQLVRELVERFGALEAVDITDVVRPLIEKPTVTPKATSAPPSNRRA
jgi:predicted nucleic acid-binding Zn ribbon protein